MSGTYGIECRRCGHPYSRVTDSRKRGPWSRRRRRECVACGYRFTTVEQIVRSKNETTMPETPTPEMIEAMCEAMEREVQAVEDVQIFFYGDLHVVRDLARTANDQRLFHSKDRAEVDAWRDRYCADRATHAAYAALRRHMMGEPT